MGLQTSYIKILIVDDDEDVFLLSASTSKIYHAVILLLTGHFLFEPYFTSKRNGIGLGLASTLTILQSHKGSIELKTKVGEGTTFILTFNKP